MKVNGTRGRAGTTSPGWEREVERRLLAADVRFTAGRRRVTEALAGASGPLSAAEVDLALGGTVPLSSIYRTLNVLEEAGVAVPHFGARGLTRYEPAEWITGHHHHLVCLECGAVEDVEIPASHEASVKEMVEDIGAEACFTPSTHMLEIEGLCVRCA